MLKSHSQFQANLIVPGLKIGTEAKKSQRSLGELLCSPGARQESPARACSCETCMGTRDGMRHARGWVNWAVASALSLLLAGCAGVVYTENSVRIDLATESPNVIGVGRAVMLFAGAIRLAVQIEEPA
jgi:hypothetical protein